MLYFGTLLFLFKTINFWNSVSIHILIKNILAFSSYSLNLKTAKLKHVRISNWKFELYGRELFVLIYVQGAWRCLRLKISFGWFRLFYFSYFSRLLIISYTSVTYCQHTLFLFEQKWRYFCKIVYGRSWNERQIKLTNTF